MTAPEYEIRTVADFLKVPANRMSDCLRDFATWTELCRPTINELFDDAFGDGAVRFNDDVFVWRDDGQGGISSIDFFCGDTSIGRIEL